jgi:hypothetical protein
MEWLKIIQSDRGYMNINFIRSVDVVSDDRKKYGVELCFCVEVDFIAHGVLFMKDRIIHLNYPIKAYDDYVKTCTILNPDK